MTVPSTDRRKGKSKYNFPPHPYFTAFTASISSPETRLGWTSSLHLYMAHHGMKSYPELVGDEGSVQNSRMIEARIIDYIAKRKEAGITSQTLANNLAALRHFYTMNDIDGIKWEKVRRYLGERIKTVDDKAYTHEQISKLLQYVDYRMRVLVLLQVSTGMRIGGIVGGHMKGMKLPYLKLGDLEFIERHGIYAIKVYKRTPAEYLTFCSPECAMAIQEYLRYREQSGEKLTPDSPLIREQFHSQSGANPRPLTKGSALQIISTALVKAGLRTKGETHKRKENMLSHGFRKFARKWMRKSGIDPLIIEYLIGHQSGDMKAGVSKLMMTYDPAEDNELLSEYLKAIPNLTISDEERQRLVAKKEKERADYTETVIAKDLELVKLEMQRMKAEQAASSARFESKKEQAATDGADDSA